MQNVVISLPDKTNASAETRAAEDGFGTIDSYIANLIESDAAAVAVPPALEVELLAGLGGEGRVISGPDWEAKRSAL